MKHTYFQVCPVCGAHLDPGERCDCQHETEHKECKTMKNYTSEYAKGFQDGKRFIIDILKYLQNYETNNPEAEVTVATLNNAIEAVRRKNE